MNKISQILITKASTCNSIKKYLTESSNFDNGLKNETNEDPGLNTLDRSFGQLEELLSEVHGQQEKLPHLLTELKSSLDVVSFPPCRFDIYHMTNAATHTVFPIQNGRTE